jgi:hypothetical protein
LLHLIFKITGKMEVYIFAITEEKTMIDAKIDGD